MVVVMAEVEVFVAHRTVAETAAMGKTETAHQLEGFPDKIPFQRHALVSHQLVQFTGRHMVLGLQEGVDDLKPVLETVDPFLAEQLLKLIYFLCVKRFHATIQGAQRKPRHSYCQRASHRSVNPGREA